MWKKEVPLPKEGIYPIRNYSSLIDFAKRMVKQGSSNTSLLDSIEIKLTEEQIRGIHKNLKIIQIFKRLYEEVICIPDEYWLNYSKIIKESEAIIKAEKPDLIMSQYPNIFHFAAKNLSKKYKLPWVADFVDLWSQNFLYSYSKFRYAIDFKLEKNLLKQADLVSTVSPVWADKLKIFNNNSICIEHSFREVSPYPNKSEVLKILYAGRIYPSIQHYEDFLSYLSSFLENHPKYRSQISVDFVGEGANSQIRMLAKSLNLDEIIKINERIPFDELEEKKKDSNMLLIFPTSSKEDGWYTSKLFDYIGSNREILAIGREKDNFMVKMLLEKDLGKFIDSYQQFDLALKEYFRNIKDFGVPIVKDNSQIQEKYSAKIMVERFTKEFDKLLKK